MTDKEFEIAMDLHYEDSERELWSGGIIAIAQRFAERAKPIDYKVPKTKEQWNKMLAEMSKGEEREFKKREAALKKLHHEHFLPFYTPRYTKELLCS